MTPEVRQLREVPVPVVAEGQALVRVTKRLRVEGLHYSGYAAKFEEDTKQLGMWKMTGKIKDKQTLVKGTTV